MYNKDLFDEIIKVEVPFSELKRFVRKLTMSQFDLDDPFHKYFGATIIKKALDKFLNNEIKRNYLALWCHAYCWILSGGFKTRYWESRVFKNLIEEWVFNMITDSLDSLSFIDCFPPTEEEEIKEERDRLDSSKFFFYERVLNTCEDWDFFYSKGNIYRQSDYHDVMFINHKTKEIITSYLDEAFDYPFTDSKKEIEFNILEAKEEELLEQGYINVCDHRSDYTNDDEDSENS